MKHADRVLEWIVWGVAALVVVALIAGPSVIGAKEDATANSPSAPAYPPAGGTASTPAARGTAAGKAVFASAGCGGCHTLAAAGSTGSTGPDLDDLHPGAAAVADAVRDGRGVMPAFKGQLDDAQIDAVAAFVATSAGG